jgi:hypothetical protein
MLTNREAINNLKRLGKKAVGEVSRKCMAEMNIKESAFGKTMKEASFTVDQRLIFDKICKTYFEIRPEVLEEQ